jgi:hypothetical protein
MTGQRRPYDVKRALRDGLEWSAGIEPRYPTHRWLLRLAWPAMLVLAAAVVVVAGYVGMLR